MAAYPPCLAYGRNRIARGADRRRTMTGLRKAKGQAYHQHTSSQQNTYRLHLAFAPSTLPCVLTHSKWRSKARGDRLRHKVQRNQERAGMKFRHSGKLMLPPLWQSSPALSVEL